MKKLLTLISLVTLLGCNKNTETESYFIFRNNGADMPVYVEGNLNSDAYILMLHGGPGGSGSDYNAGKSAELIENEFAVVYWDQRGQGNSASASPSELRIQTLSNDVNVLVKLLKEKYGSDKKIFLLGHSWGGTLGTHALLNTDLQDHINGWIEVDGAHDLPLLNQSAIGMFLRIGQEEIDAGNSVEQWQEIVDWASGVDSMNVSHDESGQVNSYAYTAEDLLQLPSSGQGIDDRGGFNYLFGKSNPLVSAIQGNITNSALNDEIEAMSPDNMSDIKVPSLLLWGKYDFVVPPALGVSAANQIDNDDVELVIFQESGHSPMDNEAELYFQEVYDFIVRNL